MSKNMLPMHVNRMQRHSHNISGGYTSTLTTGPIVPQYCHILSPGDSIYYQPKMFVRLRDVVTAFFGEIDIQMDAFFVPLQMLYTPFGQVFAQTNDVISSLFNQRQILQQSFPLLNYDYNNIINNSVLSGSAECLGKRQARLYDAVGLNPLTVLCNIGHTDSGIHEGFCHNLSGTPWLLAAYQCIYQNFYRNDDLERRDVHSYNFDEHYNEDIFANSSMMVTRNCYRPSDYFTDVKISPLYSSINTLGEISSSEVNGGRPIDILSNVRQYLIGNNFGFDGGFPQEFGHDISRDYSVISAEYKNGDGDSSSYMMGNASVGSAVANSKIGTQDIRILFAVDKFLRVYGRAGKTYDDQMLAHFGVKIPHDVKHQLTHLGHWQSPLTSDPIFATAETTNSGVTTPLGSVGGQGSVTVEGKGKKFTAPVHGVFMIVAYANVKPRYQGTVSKLNFINDRLFFPIPEYDKLGLQPLYGFEANPFFNTNRDNTNVMSGYRIGWQERYNEFKRKWNRVSLSYWSSNLVTNAEIAYNAFNPWVLTRNPYPALKRVVDDYIKAGVYSSSFALSYEELIERENALDNIMLQSIELGFDNAWYHSPWLMFQSDPLITEFYCDAKLVSWMSPTGDADL